MEREERMTMMYGEPALRESLDAGAAGVMELANVGIIYLGWHGEAHHIRNWRGRWAAFAEAGCAAWNGLPGKLVGKQWLNGDLFVYVQGPAEAGRPFEEWLLRFGMRMRTSWEEAFRRDCLSEWPYGARLHVGAAAVTNDMRANLEPNGRYELLKRALIHGQRPDAPERSLKRMAFERIVGEGLIDPVYQPIVSLADGGVFGYEALSRLRDQEWFGSPLQLFKFAEEEGGFYALDRLARTKAIAGCGIGRSGPKLFVNMSAHIMEDPHFTPGQTRVQLARYGLVPADVVFELTERTSIDDFAAAKRVLAHYRSQGYRIAIDDVGAGYSSLQSIVELRPDYLKVDRSIVESIDRDETKRHVMATVVRLAEQTGSEVIAEGIERPEELEVVRAMGVPLGQGYLLGRPARRA